MSTSTEVTAMPKVEITGPEPMVIDPTDAKRRPVLNADEARMLTTEIQKTTARLWLLVTEAHDRSAHFALGYDSWDDYARAELKMSPSRSYQLLDTGHVMRELARSGVDITATKVPPARVVARIKDRLPEVRKAVREAVKSGTQPDEVLRELAREPRRKDPSEGGPTASDGARPDGRRTALLTCPACAGEGKVTRSLAGKLRSFLKSDN